ncbi:MAG: hypothetical protein IPJ88_08940 [Myxococcales bacterium]|nr:MAG: hypothetical protein IPJ88_08940 [Myxococcales bacterium]
MSFSKNTRLNLGICIAATASLFGSACAMQASDLDSQSGASNAAYISPNAYQYCQGLVDYVQSNMGLIRSSASLNAALGATLETINVTMPAQPEGGSMATLCEQNPQINESDPELCANAIKNQQQAVELMQDIGFYETIGEGFGQSGHDWI